MNPPYKEIIVCAMCGLVVSLSIVPHNCEQSPYSNYIAMKTENPPVCEILDERHAHAPEAQYPTTQYNLTARAAMGSLPTVSGTMFGTQTPWGTV